MMRFAPKITTLSQLEESSDTSGSGRGTSLAELRADGAKMFSSGIHEPKDALSVGLQQDGSTTQ